MDFTRVKLFFFRFFPQKQKIENLYSQKGFSVLEVVIAAALFVIFATGGIITIIQGLNTNRLGSEETIANQYNVEGMEAVRSIKNQAFSNLIATGSAGVVTGSGASLTVTKDASSFKSAQNVTSVSWAHTTANQNNRLMIVGVSIAAQHTVLSVTYGSQNLTQLKTLDCDTDSCYGELWYLVAPNVGTANVTITIQNSTSGLVGGAITYYNVNQVNPFLNNPVTATGPGSSFSVSLNTTSTNQMVVDVAAMSSTNQFNQNASQSLQWLDNTWQEGAASSKQGVNGTTSMSWTNTVSGHFAEIAAIIQPSSSAPTWSFSGTNNTLGSDNRFVRTIAVSPVQRDSSGNIVASGGVWDSNTMKVVVTTSWNFTSVRPESVSLIEYMTNWRTPIGGMLVYGDGGTTADAIKFQTFDSSTSAWNVASSAADVDTATTNKAVRGARLFASATRNEKVLITRHYNGSGSRFLYAQVYNGSSWGNVNLLAPAIASNAALDIQDFDGTYLANGDFMVVYSDNTNTPKFKTWNGSTWSIASGTIGTSMQLLGGVPVYVVLSARSGSNEMMATFTNNNRSVQTEYYNGTTPYATANWSAVTTHAASGNTPLTTKKFADFQWSGNSPTTGILAYTDSATDKTMTIHICTASGGACAWGTAVNAGTAQTNTMGAIDLEPRPTANEFQACDKDAAATPTIVCYKVTFSGTIPTISAPVIIAAATDTGIQRSFDIDWENVSGTPAVLVYSDNTAVPKYKQYTPGTSTWDASATTITTTGTPGIFKTVKLIPNTANDDIMALMADANLDVFSVVWSGTASAMYTYPPSETYTGHGVNGSATGEFWYDFAWDRF